MAEQYEQIVIGTMLLQPDQIAVAADQLDALAFTPKYARIYTALIELHQQGEPVNFASVAGRLGPDADVALLLDCTQAVPTSAGSVGWYVAQLADAARLRDDQVDLARLSQALDAGDLDKIGQVKTDLAQRWADGKAVRPGGDDRVVDLAPFLDGTYVPPVPSVGAVRDDGVRLLYPSRWHTMIALTGTGKSWFALGACAAEICRGRTVVYAHFEEAGPGGTLERLSQLGVTHEQILARFVWVDCSSAWALHRFAGTLAGLPGPPSLVVLDGINAACGQHGWPVDKPEAVGEYRARFVSPAVALGAAVLSLGHPPKARDRQGERHSFGSTAWLDIPDGVGFRLEASKQTPIRLGHAGYSELYSVKDRYGQVEVHGVLADQRESGWYRLGKLIVDDITGATQVRLVAPSLDADGRAPDEIDRLGRMVVTQLAAHGGRFESTRRLQDLLRAAGVTLRTAMLAPAIERLVTRGEVTWPEMPTGKPRPGWLTVSQPTVSGSLQEPLPGGV